MVVKYSTEDRIIRQLDRKRDSDPRAKFAHLFRTRTTNPFTLRVLGTFYDTNRTRSANATRVNTATN